MSQMGKDASRSCIGYEGGDTVYESFDWLGFRFNSRTHGYVEYDRNSFNKDLTCKCLHAVYRRAVKYRM